MNARIALILTTFPQLSETFIVNKFVSLLDKGWDIHIVCSNFSKNNWTTFDSLRNHPELRKRIHQSPPTSSKILAALLYLPILLLTFFVYPARVWRYFRIGGGIHGLSIFRKFYIDAPLIWLNPHVIHFEFGALAVGRETLAKCIGCKMVVSFRGYDLNFSGLEDPNYYREIWKYADGLHFLGEDLWARALRRGCPADKLKALIPPALDTELFKPANERNLNEDIGSVSRPLRLLSVGRLEWKKGYEFAIQAIRILIDNGIACEYRIIGEGQFSTAIAFARHQLQLDDTVHFLGFRTREQIIAQYAWADIFIHTAVSEGFCNAVLEAQAMQIPVVCTDADGLAENVAVGISGFVVARRNPQAVASKVKLLIESPKLRDQMGKAGRKRVILKFQLENQANQFSDFYTQVLKAK